jgi:Protein of unknown function (DUF992).
MLRSLILAAALLTSVQAAMAQAPKTWTQVGMLTCKLNPSIGFVIFGHQSMECRFVQNPPFPVQLYEGALNTVGVDIGISAGGELGWAVLAPTAGPPPGALAGEYIGATGEVGHGSRSRRQRFDRGLWKEFRFAAGLRRRIGCPECHARTVASSITCRALNPSFAFD